MNNAANDISHDDGVPFVSHAGSLCDLCGAEKRGDAAFCYKCGGKIFHAATDLENISDKPSETEPAARDAVSATEQNVAGARVSKRPLTAAMLRRQRTRRLQRPARAVWSPPESDSNLFVIISVVLTLVAAFLLIGSFYLN